MANSSGTERTLASTWCVGDKDRPSRWDLRGGDGKGGRESDVVVEG